MKKLSVLSLMVMVSVAVFAIATNFTDAESTSGDYQRAVGIATGALSDCISDARKAGNEILDSGVAGENDGDWTIAFCGRQTPTQSPAQFVGSVKLENWKVMETNCEFPSPTSNPCPVF